MVQNNTMNVENVYEILQKKYIRKMLKNIKNVVGV